MGELQEYGDNYYRWLRQGQGLESADSQELGSDGSAGDGDAVSRIASDNNNVGDVAGGGAVSANGNVLGRVDDGGGVDVDDDASCPDIGFAFDPDGQVPNTHTLTMVQPFLCLP